MWIQVIESPLGDLTAYWSELGISRLTFGQQEEFDADVAAPGAESGPRALVSCLAEYFNGGELDFPRGAEPLLAHPRLRWRARGVDDAVDHTRLDQAYAYAAAR